MAKKDDVPDVCKGCVKWDLHGKNCWVFWDMKKVCTHYEDRSGDNKPGFRKLKESEFWDLSQF